MVALAEAEYREAVEHGRMIYRSSQSRGLRDHRTFVRDGVNGERVQVLGSLAERAVAKACAIPWTRCFDNFKGSDLDFNIEVRLIGKDHYGLRVYERDHPSRRIVGVVIRRGNERGVYRIPGWINAAHGRRSEWLIDPLGRKRPVYAVPQNRLHPISALLSLIAKETSA